MIFMRVLLQPMVVVVSLKLVQGSVGWLGRGVVMELAKLAWRPESNLGTKIKVDEKNLLHKAVP